MKNNATSNPYLKLAVIGITLFIILIATIVSFVTVQKRSKIYEAVDSTRLSLEEKTQNVKGPILVIPYLNENEEKHKVVILPDLLTYNLHFTDSEKDKPARTKGLYAKLATTASFKAQAIEDHIKTHVKPKETLWEEATISLLTKGTKEKFKVVTTKVNAQDLKIEEKNPSVLKSGLDFHVPYHTLKKDFKVETTTEIINPVRIILPPLGINVIFNAKGEAPYVNFGSSSLPALEPQKAFSSSAPYLISKFDDKVIHLDDIKNYSRSNNNHVISFIYSSLDKLNSLAMYILPLAAMLLVMFYIIDFKHGANLHILQYIFAGSFISLFHFFASILTEYLPFELSFFICALLNIVINMLYLKTSIPPRTKNFITLILLQVLMFAYIYLLIMLPSHALVLSALGIFVFLSAAIWTTRNFLWRTTP